MKSLTAENEDEETTRLMLCFAVAIRTNTHAISGKKNVLELKCTCYFLHLRKIHVSNTPLTSLAVRIHLLEEVGEVCLAHGERLLIVPVQQQGRLGVLN